jgi:hypothetical protein
MHAAGQYRFASGSNTCLIATYIDHNRGGLADVPAALFAVSASGSLRDVDPGGFLEEFVDNVGWRPDVAAALAKGAWADLQRFADEVATRASRRPR